MAYEEVELEKDNFEASALALLAHQNPYLFWVVSENGDHEVVITTHIGNGINDPETVRVLLKRTLALLPAPSDGAPDHN